jgi:hypothetical protein
MTSNETAIAHFLNSGGRISRLAESISVSENELLAYLATRGIVARYVAGDRRTYLCGGKRMSVHALVALTNEHRSSDALPPFVLRINLAPSRSKTRGYSSAE